MKERYVQERGKWEKEMGGEGGRIVLWEVVRGGLWRMMDEKARWRGQSGNAFLWKNGKSDVCREEGGNR